MSSFKEILAKVDQHQADLDSQNQMQATFVAKQSPDSFKRETSTSSRSSICSTDSGMEMTKMLKKLVKNRDNRPIEYSETTNAQVETIQALVQEQHQELMDKQAKQVAAPEEANGNDHLSKSDCKSLTFGQDMEYIDELRAREQQQKQQDHDSGHAPIKPNTLVENKKKDC